MLRKVVASVGILTAVLAVVTLLAPCQAAGGRTAPVVSDLTSIPAGLLRGDTVSFVANYTDAEGEPAATRSVVIDGVVFVMAEEDPLDTNTTDGKLYSFDWTAVPGSHAYEFHFAEGGNWTNTTSKGFDVRWAPASGNWEADGPLVVPDAQIELRGDLIVMAGAVLELRNTTLRFNADADGKYGITVSPGATLKLSEGAKVTKSTGSKAYNFKVMPGGALEIKGSEVWYAGYENPADNSLMALYTQGSTLIENSVITATCKGIMAENCNVVMRNTTVKEAYRRNVEATNATILMEDCVVDHSTDACNVEFFAGTRATIVRCTIQKNGHNGIWMKDGAQATVTGCLITDSNQNGIWMDNGCTLTISDTVIEKAKQNGMWINGSSTVTATNVTIRNNAMNGTWISGGRITMTLSTIDTHELHGFAGFDGCQVTFTKNHVNNSKRHNYETTNCTTLMEDCRFEPSREACNVEFFIRSKATVKNTVIKGAGHNCFWLSDNVEVTIEGGNFSSSPNNVIWANLSSKVTVRNCVLWGAQKNGIWAADSTITVDGCTIRDNGLGNGPEGWGIEVENCTLTVTNTNFQNNPKGQIWVKNYLAVKALDDKGKALKDATVTVKNQTKAQVASGKSDARGLVPTVLLTSYITDNAGKKTDHDYTVSVSKGDLRGSQTVKLDASKAVEVKAKAKANAQPGFELVALAAAVAGVAVLLRGRKQE